LSADALIARFEQEKSRALGRSLRRHAGLYYTPPEIAARVIEVALRSGGGASSGRVLDPAPAPARSWSPRRGRGCGICTGSIWIPRPCASPGRR